MKLIEKMAMEWLRTQLGRGAEGVLVNAYNDWVERGSVKAYEAGFRAAKEMAAKTLGPPWPYAILSTPSGNITWDRDGMKLIQKEILRLGES